MHGSRSRPLQMAAAHQRPDDMRSIRMTERVVIVGAGFGGMAVAQHLAHLLSGDACEIVVVDQNDFSLFTPMLTEVVGGEVNAEEIVASIRSLTPRVTFQQGRITAIDAKAKTVTVSIGDEALDIPPLERTLEADQLV